MSRTSPMISYAQNFEDVILDRVFREQELGFYVDVGANDPSAASVTRHFYERGWHGINIDPCEKFPEWSRARPRDRNLNVAATDSLCTLTFHEFPLGRSLGSVNPEISGPMLAFAEGRYTREVPGVPLREILAEHANNITIDFLKVDVEGHEREVLMGNDWQRYRPRVVLVEATEPMRPVPNHERWEGILTGNDYDFVYFDGLNRFYLRCEDAGLRSRFQTPPNVFDDFIPSAVHELRRQLTETQDQLRQAQEELDRTRREEIENTRRVEEYRRLCRGVSGGALEKSMPLARLLTRIKSRFRGQRTPDYPH